MVVQNQQSAAASSGVASSAVTSEVSRPRSRALDRTSSVRDEAEADSPFLWEAGGKEKVRRGKEMISRTRYKLGDHGYERLEDDRGQKTGSLELHESDRVRRSRSRLARPRQRPSALRARLQDNTQEIQARFKNPPDPVLGSTAQMRHMVENLTRLVRIQLAQYTGGEPYLKSDYRMFLSTFQNLRGTGKKDEDGWGAARVRKDNDIMTLLDKCRGLFGIFDAPLPVYAVNLTA